MTLRHLLTWALVLGLTTAASAIDVNDFIVWSGGLPGRLYVPDNYDPATAYPIIIYYHGLGNPGTDNVSQLNGIDGLFARCQTREVFLYAPQSPYGWWPDSEIAMVMDKLAETKVAYNIDPDRVYVTGNSAGGIGVYNSLEVHGHIIAAGFMTAGAGGGGRPRAAMLVGKPLWLFHAADDGTVGVNQSRGTVNAIRHVAGKPDLVFPLDADPNNPYYNTGEPYYTDGTTFYSEDNTLYTEYDTGGHGIRTRVYNEEWMYDWLLGMRLQDAINAAPVVDAGPDVIFHLPENSLVLDAAAEDDGRPYAPGEITTLWEQISGPGTVSFDDAAAVNATATFSELGTYVLRLSAYDSEHLTSDTVTITYLAGPQLEYDRVDLGDGLYGWTFRIGNDDGLMLSYAATLSFYTDAGTELVNVQINDMDVNDEPTADFVSQFGFDKDRDTYSLTPFVNTNSIPGNSLLWGDTFTGYREGDAFDTGSVQGDGWWEMSVGTGSGSQYGDGTPVAYVVAGGNVRWAGTIARNNKLHHTEGATSQGTILGDYTGDGVVDQADYTYWADHFGQMCSDYFAPGSYAEPDHAINTPEYTTWADHFGNTASQTLGMTQSIVPVGAAEPMLVTGGAAEGDYNNDGKVDLADYTVWADSFIQTDNAPALEAVQSQTPAVEEEPAEELTPAQTRREKMQARRATILARRAAARQARQHK